MQARFITPQIVPATITGTSTADGSLTRPAAAACACPAGCGISANTQSTATAQTAPEIITAGQPSDSPIQAWIGSAIIAPNGQLICNSDIASTISLAANQSATILVATRMTIVAPTPPTVRAASATARSPE